MNAKPIYWITLTRWMSLTLEEHGELDRFVSKRGCELGIDVAGYHTDQPDDVQKDHDEYIEDVSLGGRRYKVR